jgi:hypothetical protein
VEPRKERRRRKAVCYVVDWIEVSHDIVGTETVFVNAVMAFCVP